MLDFIQVSKLCYNALKEYEAENDEFNLPEWGQSEELKQLAINSTIRMLRLSCNTGKLAINPETNHASFAADIMFRGWKYGPAFSEENKTHDRLKPFCFLSPHQQKKSDVILSVFRQHEADLREQFWHLFQDDPERQVPGGNGHVIHNIEKMIIHAR